MLVAGTKWKFRDQFSLGGLSEDESAETFSRSTFASIRKVRRMKFMKSVRPYCLLLLMFIGGRLLMADPVLDQYSFVSAAQVCCGAGFATTLNGQKQLAQTFTVGNTGILDEVDLVLSNQWVNIAGSNPNIFFDIRPVVAGIPVEDNSLALVSRQVAVFSNPLGLYLLPALGIPVTHGDVLAIVLRSGFYGAFVWADGDKVYPRGSSYVREPDNPSNFDYTWYGPYEANAFAFQTFVEPVPEPSSLVVLVAGILACLLLSAGANHRLCRASTKAAPPPPDSIV
jgi:hypothetical protein